MFKAAEVGRKIRETNLLINMQINLSSSRISDLYFQLSLQQLSWDLLGTKNISSTHVPKCLEGKQIVATENMWQKSHRVYPPEIINQFAGYAAEKNHWDTMTACMQHLYCNEISGNPQQTISLVYKITFKQISKGGNFV